MLPDKGDIYAFEKDLKIVATDKGVVGYARMLHACPKQP